MRSVSAVAALALLAGGAAVSTPHAHAARHVERIVSHDTARKTVVAKIDTYLKGLAARNQLSGTVLVARKGTVLLSRGYGMAVRERRVPNRPSTRYPLPGISFSLSLAAGLRLEDQGKLKDSASVCSYVATCPASWKPITVHMVLDGTSGLSDSGWGEAGHTTMQSLAHCQGESLTAAPGSRLNYQNCTVVVLGTIFQRVSGKPWQTFMRQEIFGPAGMKNSGRMTDALVPPARAQDYSGTAPDTDVVYNDYFQVYGTVPDVYAYDNALFGGRLLSRTSLRRLVAARGSVSPPDAYITEEHQAAKWKVGSLLGHQVTLTTDNTKSFTGANLRFPGDGVTVIAISNDDQNDVEAVAVHAAAMVFGKTLAAQPAPAGLAPTTVDPAQAILAMINLGHPLAPPIVADGAVWTGTDAGMVVRVDATINAVTATIKGSDSTLCGECGLYLVLATAQDQIWVADPAGKRLVRIDPTTNAITASIPIGIKVTDLAVAAGSLWAISLDNNSLVRVDPAVGKVIATINNLPAPAQIAATDDAVWVSTYGDSMVHRIDPATNRISASIHVNNFPESLAVDKGTLWVSTNRPQNLVRIDTQTNKIVVTIPLSSGTNSDMQGPCCRAVAVGEGAVWAIAHHNRSLDRIDPHTNTITATLALPTPSGVGRIEPWDVAVGEGSIWINADPGILYRIDPKAMGTP